LWWQIFRPQNIYRKIILSFHAIALTSFTEGIYKFGYWPISSWRIELFAVCQHGSVKFPARSQMDYEWEL